MGNTSFILLRGAARDGLPETPPQFAELTGAYWLEPIYTGLANEWSRKGRAVPGSPTRRLEVLAEGPDAPEPGDEPG
jgi:hypothetical protein